VRCRWLDAELAKTSVQAAIRLPGNRFNSFLFKEWFGFADTALIAGIHLLSFDRYMKQVDVVFP
jgi:hypothetical protein